MISNNVPQKLRFFELLCHPPGQLPNFFPGLISEIKATVGWFRTVPIGPESVEIRMCIDRSTNVGMIILTFLCDLPLFYP